MFDQEKLTQAVAKHLAETMLQSQKSTDERPSFVVGETILIRTVTYAAIGKVEAFNSTFVWLKAGAGWLADSGRYSKALETGEVDEFEACNGPRRIGIGAIVDVACWDHAIPDTK